MNLQVTVQQAAMTHTQRIVEKIFPYDMWNFENMLRHSVYICKAEGLIICL